MSSKCAHSHVLETSGNPENYPRKLKSKQEQVSNVLFLKQRTALSLISLFSGRRRAGCAVTVPSEFSFCFVLPFETGSYCLSQVGFEHVILLSAFPLRTWIWTESMGFVLSAVQKYSVEIFKTSPHFFQEIAWDSADKEHVRKKMTIVLPSEGRKAVSGGTWGLTLWYWGEKLMNKSHYLRTISVWLQKCSSPIMTLVRLGSLPPSPTRTGWFQRRQNGVWGAHHL